ncbi:MAG: hypothetical protein WA632_12430, partial [Gallionella sp.]
SIQHSKLTNESIAELTALSKKLSSQLLDTVGQRAAELEVRDAHKPEAHQRMRLGVYFFNEIPKKPEATGASVTPLRA